MNLPYERILQKVKETIQIAIEKLVDTLKTDGKDIPVIACGGVGEWNHFSQVLDNTSVDAVAAANIFHYIDQSVYLAKKYLYDSGYNFRRPDLIKIK